MFIYMHIAVKFWPDGRIDLTGHVDARSDRLQQPCAIDGGVE
jgi:hypothetical protein